MSTGVCLPRGYLARGHVCPDGGSQGGGCLPARECLSIGCLPREVSGCGGVCPGGVYLPGSLSRRRCLADTHPHPVNRIFLAHASENIAFPQLHLRTVEIKVQYVRKGKMESCY